MKDRCEAIRRLDPPKTVRDCRKFCGMVNFLATFLKDLQKILIPIYNLTRKSTKFLWTEECQTAFDHINFFTFQSTNTENARHDWYIWTDVRY